MALSYFNESEAPRDFRVSSTESDGHYKKCLLCYTVKKNFYCPDCVRAGNFVHSSMPYADRYVLPVIYAVISITSYNYLSLTVSALTANDIPDFKIDGHLCLA